MVVGCAFSETATANEQVIIAGVHNTRTVQDYGVCLFIGNFFCGSFRRHFYGQNNCIGAVVMQHMYACIDHYTVFAIGQSCQVSK